MEALGAAEPFRDADMARAFICAGNARVTLVSLRTHKRYTYRVRAKDDDQEQRTPPQRKAFFVELLTGRDNENDFKYVGMIRGDDFFVTRATRHMETADFVRGFRHVFRNLTCRHRIPDDVEVWHENRCGRCNRPLTVPESIRTGFGPECIKLVGG